MKRNDYSGVTLTGGHPAGTVGGGTRGTIPNWQGKEIDQWARMLVAKRDQKEIGPQEKKKTGVPRETQPVAAKAGGPRGPGEGVKTPRGGNVGVTTGEKRWET